MKRSSLCWVAPVFVLAAACLTTGCIAVGGFGDRSAKSQYQFVVTEPGSDNEAGQILRLNTETGAVERLEYDQGTTRREWKLIE